MKKLIGMILALVMVFSLSMTAMAADVDAGDISGGTSQNVTATYEGTTAGEIATVYYVNIAWAAGENTLKYTNNQATYAWDAEQCKYVVANAGDVAQNGWSGSAVYTVTVTNKSNATIYATPSVVGATDITANGAYSEGTPVKWADNKLTLTSAAVDGEGNALTPGADVAGTAQTGSVKVTVTVDGENSEGINANATVATITVNLTHD